MQHHIRVGGGVMGKGDTSLTIREHVFVSSIFPATGRKGKGKKDTLLQILETVQETY